MESIIITIYALATLLATDTHKEFYAQQFSFKTKDECVEYYTNNQADLLNGLMEYAKQAHNDQVRIKEAGCALIDISKIPVIGKPEMISKFPIYTPTSA